MLSRKTRASAKQEKQLIAFVEEIYRVQINHFTKYLIWLFCHALVFRIAIAGTKQEINENKDAEGTFIYELIQLPPKLRPFVYFKAAKSAWIFLFFFFPYFYKVIQVCLFFSSPVCMSKEITAWFLQGRAALAGDNWKQTGGIFFPSQPNILHWANIFQSLFDAKEVEKWLGRKLQNLYQPLKPLSTKRYELTWAHTCDSFPKSIVLPDGPAGATHRDLQWMLIQGLGWKVSEAPNECRFFPLYLEEEEGRQIWYSRVKNISPGKEPSR